MTSRPLTGQVVDAVGAPLVGATITALLDGRQVALAACDDEGRFRLVVAPGGAVLVVACAGHAPYALRAPVTADVPVVVLQRLAPAAAAPVAPSAAPGVWPRQGPSTAAGPTSGGACRAPPQVSCCWALVARRWGRPVTRRSHRARGPHG